MRLPNQNETFAGEYVIHDELGQGGFAVVYRASRNGQAVALKVLKPQNGAYPLDLVARFNREARLLAQLTHPNIPRIFGHGRSPDGLLYIASELIPGEELRELIGRGPVGEALAEHVVRQVLEALSRAHAIGLLHRDIKPENIRLTQVPGALPRVVLLDFGLARNSEEEKGARLTETGVLVGTPRYMSPEQLTARPLTPASDIYSLAMVGVEMLLGDRALHGGSLTDQVDRMTGRAAIPIPATQGPLAELLRQGLSLQPQDRPQSAGHALRVLSGIADVASPVVEEKRSQKTLIAVSLLGLLAVLLLAAYLWNREETPEVPEARIQPNPLGEALTVRSEEPKLDMHQTDSGVDGGQADAGSWPPYTQPPKSEACRGLSAEPPGVFWLYGEPNAFDAHAVKYVVPQGYDPSRAYPLVLLFNDGIPDGPGPVLRNSGFIDVADRYGFIVAAIGDAKPIGARWTEKKMGLLSDGVEVLRKTVCADLQRIYVVGNGRGGRAAMFAPCVLRKVEGAQVRAVATNGWRSDTSGREDCSARLPYIHIVGLRDPDMPPQGPRCSQSDGHDLLTLPEHDALWVKQLECKGRASVWEGDEECETWSCEHPYVSCKFDAGRSWGAIGNCSTGGPPTPGLAERMWKFFDTIQ